MPVCASDNTTLSEENDFLSSLDTVMVVCIFDNFKRIFFFCWFQKGAWTWWSSFGRMPLRNWLHVNKCFQAIFFFKLCENVRFLDQTDKNLFQITETDKTTEEHDMESRNNKNKIGNHILHPPFLLKLHWKWKWVLFFFRRSDRDNCSRAESLRKGNVSIYLS